LAEKGTGSDPPRGAVPGGFSLVECLVYIGVLMILLHAGRWVAYYRVQKGKHRGAGRGNAADIHCRKCEAGERVGATMVRKATGAAALRWLGGRGPGTCRISPTCRARSCMPFRRRGRMAAGTIRPGSSGAEDCACRSEKTVMP